MPTVEPPGEHTLGHRAPVPSPAVFDAFWERTINETRGFPLNPVFQQTDNCLAVIDTLDVTYSGYGGNRIKGWLHVPSTRQPGQKLPVVVQYPGYSDGRGLPWQDTKWAQAGYAHFIMDVRGQGYGGVTGETPDPHSSAGGVSFAGVMTRGAGSPSDYYYRRVFMDAFRAVETVQSHPEIDSSKVIITGISQGGGITVAVAGLAEGRLKGIIAALPDVPFLQDFQRALDSAERGPYLEITAFLSRHRDKYEPMLNLLSYFDGVMLGRVATVPALFSVAQMDDICPPATVYASFNSYGSGAGTHKPVEKDIEIYRFNNHEGGQEHHWKRQIDFLHQLLAR